MFKYYDTRPDVPLYDPAVMRDFCEKNAPGLFDLLLRSITRDDNRVSSDRESLQRQRTVSLIHILSYFRSQKTCQLQKDSGLYSSLGGLSLQGLSPGPVLGFSVNPRTVQNMKKGMAKTHNEHVTKQLQQVVALNCFMINFLDDYHNIHTRHVPTDLQKNSVAHMASSMLDIHPHIPAVKRTTVSPHRKVKVSIKGEDKICLGGVDSSAVLLYINRGLKDMRNHFIDQLPAQMKNLNPGNFHNLVQNFRVYSQPYEQDIESLQSCQLLDEFEQDLKSLKNYKDSLDRVMTEYPDIKTYLERNLLPFPADWPGWYYPKKLIANNCSGKYNSLIPEQGQFHVALNAVEDTVIIFMHFFEKLFSHLFGGTLPKKPRPYQSSLCVTAALLGWLMVRDKVLKKFTLCKSHEFVSTLYLLDDVIPLVYFQYQIFRTGNLELYMSVMAQMAILFNIWRRKHYDKSTLSFLSDSDYQKNFLPEYWQCKQQWLYLFVEKKVEIWHSILRANTQRHDDASSISRVAKTIASSAFLTNFCGTFVPGYMRGLSHLNFWLIAGKSAEFILKLFSEIAKNTRRAHVIPSECYGNGKPKSWPKYKFPTYGIEAETKCMPLSYNLSMTLGKEPKPEVCCDLPECNSCIPGGDFVRLACYHTFHVSCLTSDHCTICKEPLKKLIETKVSQFNEGLLKNVSIESDGELDGEREDDGVPPTVLNNEANERNAEQYYTSSDWEQKADGILAAIGEVEQPHHANAQASYAHSQSQSSTIQTHSLVQQLSVGPTKCNRITSWHFPPQYSQSTLIGRLGSNACTFIALTYSKLFFSSPELLDSTRPLSNTWVYRVLASIMLGNQFYDKAAGDTAQLYGVREAATKMQQTNALGSIKTSTEFPASIIQEQLPSASLPYYFNAARNTTKTACLYIINGKTVAFIPTCQGITVFDSHFHGTSGAFVAVAPADAAYDLLAWFKSVNSIPHNLGTVTIVSFS
ncbi:uncharacterized protein LOC144658110 [Oculina patagonica]